MTHSMNAVQASPPLVLQADLRMLAAAHGVDETAGTLPKLTVVGLESSKNVSEIATLAATLITMATTKASVSNNRVFIAHLQHGIITQVVKDRSNGGD